MDMVKELFRLFISSHLTQAPYLESDALLSFILSISPFLYLSLSPLCMDASCLHKPSTSSAIALYFSLFFIFPAMFIKRDSYSLKRVRTDSVNVKRCELQTGTSSYKEAHILQHHLHGVKV